MNIFKEILPIFILSMLYNLSLNSKYVMFWKIHWMKLFEISFLLLYMSSKGKSFFILKTSKIC